MITQEHFDRLENEHGCGYWSVCWEHACPCAITVEHKGLQQSIYDSLMQEGKEIAKEFEREDDDYNYIPNDTYEDDDCFDDEDDRPDCDFLCSECSIECSYRS